MTTPNTIKKNLLGTYLFWIVSLLIGVWVVYRSVVLSITNDEAFTFYNIATRNFKMMCGTANTHWLNSIFVFFETLLIGHKEWMIRIHSFVGYFIFVNVIYKLFKQYITCSWQWFIPISFLILNIYLLDFFSLARGYGISMTFEMLGLYYICKSSDSIKDKFLIYLFLSLATFSCYTCLFILFAYFIHDLISSIRQHNFRSIFSSNFLLPVLPCIALIIVAIPNLLFIRQEGDLEEGQCNGFLQDTLGVFFQRSYPMLQNDTQIYGLCILLSGMLLLFYIAFRKELDARMTILFEMLLVNVLIIETMYFVFKIPYIFGRTSLSFNLLFLVLLIYALVFISKKIQKIARVFLSVSLLILGVTTFIFLKNHSATIEWYKTQGIEKCISDLEKLEGQFVFQKKLGMHLAQIGAYTNYYQYLNKYQLNDTVFSFCENTEGVFDSMMVGKMLQQDYLIMLKPYDKHLNASQVTVLKYYENMNADLLKVRK